MRSLASLRTHTDAIVAKLTADADMTIFDAGPPPLDSDGGGADWGWQSTPGHSKFKPYAIVYPLAGGEFDGPLGCPDNDASLTWQVTCVGSTRKQCEWGADKVLAALIGARLAVAGRYLPRLYADMAQGGARRDDTVQPPVYIATPRFRAYSTPAGGP